MSKTPTKRSHYLAEEDEQMQITPPKNLKMDKSLTPSPSRLCYQMNALDAALNEYFSPKKKSPGRSPHKSVQRNLQFSDYEFTDGKEIAGKIATKSQIRCLDFNKSCAQNYVNLCFQQMDDVLMEKSNIRNISESFPIWLMLLRSGEFNILLQGPGSKRRLLDEFIEHLKESQTSIKNMYIFVINGLNENISIHSILTRIAEEFHINNIKRRKIQPVKIAKELIKDLEKKFLREELFVLLIVKNIDSLKLRLRTNQETFSILAGSKIFKIIASVDIANAALLWNQALRDSFNWITYTIYCYMEEMENYDGKLDGIIPKCNAGKHTIESLDMFWEATTTNMQKILQQMAIHAPLYSKRNQRDPLTLPKFCHILKEEFATTSETVLRQQLIEFQDHNIIKLDKDENIYLTVDQQLLSSFLDKKFSD